jgi:hypothetical protein
MREFLKSNPAGQIFGDKRILVHNYKDFKKTDWGKEQIDKYLDRWGKLGFLDGLEGEIKERVALAMEQLAIYLIWEAVEDDSINAFETIGFPMVRRIIAGSIGNFTKLKDPDLFKFETFIKYCRELDVRKLEEKLNEVARPFLKIDGEAEACAIGCEIMIEKFNGSEKSFDELVENYITKIKNRLKDEGTSSDNTDA